jgi:hypothetical protein
MLKQQPQETEPGDVRRVDQLLFRLGNVLRPEPPPGLRTRLARMSSERPGRLRPNGAPSPSVLRRTVFAGHAIGLIAAAALLCAALIGFVVHEEGRRGEAKRAALGGPAPSSPPVARNAEAPPSAALPRPRNRGVPSGHYEGRPSNLVIPLPYSDSAVRTGTGTTIRVSLSQDELLSLGVPVNPTMHDRRFIAEMILGDDGLPRAITLPLPLTVVEERR